MASTKEGKEISKMNAVKNGLYLKFTDFFPCNLCINREKCSDFIPGGSCSIDSELFNQLVTTEIDELKVLDQLINYNMVRLSRATEQSRNRPDHIELSRISAEIRNLIQARFIIKRRIEGEKEYARTKVLQPMSDQSQLHLFQEK
ncbi:MAG TPA: hypothetical protein PLK55_01585 [archaeon]|nr:hypothetical protein [archaeon]